MERVGGCSVGVRLDERIDLLDDFLFPLSVQ